MSFKRLSECTPDELRDAWWEPDAQGNCYENCPASQHRHGNCPWAKARGTILVRKHPSLFGEGATDWSGMEFGQPCPVKLLLLALGPAPKNKRPICPRCYGAGCRACNETGVDFLTAWAESDPINR